MKHLHLLLVLLFSFQAFSQSLNVPESKKALLFKGTASWCGPCGYYHGITDEIYSDHSDSILFLNGHVASSTVGENYSGDMHNLLNGGGGIPSYSLSGVELADWPPTLDMILNESANFFSTAVIANIAFQYEIVGNEITINTTTQFFQDASADHFYVGAMIVENNIMVNQKVDNVYEQQLQHRIQRTVVGALNDMGSGKKLWADEIASGTVDAGSTFDHTLTQTLDGSWNQDELDVIVVIWQRTGDSFMALSSEDVEQNSTYISSKDEAIQWQVYPNPASESIHIEIEDYHNTQIKLTDASGKTVFSGLVHSKNTWIEISDWKQGIYYLTVNTQKYKSTKSVIVN